MNPKKRYIALTLLATSFLLFSASCSKKTEKAPEPKATAAAPQANANAAEASAQAVKLQNDETAAANARKDNPSDDATDAQDDSETDNDDSDAEIKYSEGCGPNVEDWDLSLLKFGKKNEIQGDFSQAKWSDLEPTLPLPILKVASGEDVIKQLESTVKLDCSLEIFYDDTKESSMTLKAADGTAVQLIYCSEHAYPKAYLGIADKKEYLPKGHYCSPAHDENNKAYENPKDFKTNSTYTCDDCSEEYANAAYLSLTSPKDHVTRVYQIAALNYDALNVYPHGVYISGILDFGLVSGGECSSYSQSNSLSVTNVESKPFMDTTGIYVRTEWRCDHYTEHTGGGDDDLGLIYTTWLFAGDKLRLVTHWEDAYYNRNSSSSDGPCEDCMEYCNDINYYETYMHYQSGAFETKKTIVAKTEEQFKEIISKRP